MEAVVALTGTHADTHTHTHTNSDLSLVGGLSFQSIPQLKSFRSLYLALLEHLLITLLNVFPYVQLDSCRCFNCIMV